MADAPPPKPIGEGGITFLAIVNVAAGFYLASLWWGAEGYKTSDPNKVSMVEAAYVTALWTKVAASTAGLLVFNVLVVGAQICARITALHRATIYAAEVNRRT